MTFFSSDQGQGGTSNIISRDALKGCITIGPWGGPRGTDWNHKPETPIRKIIIEHGTVISSIRFRSNGNEKCLANNHMPIFGRAGRNRMISKVEINWPSEYLRSMSGTFVSYAGQVAVESLCFCTNKAQYGPYGNETGTGFSCPAQGGVIVGFHGRADSLLNAIGIYVIPLSLAFTASSANPNTDQLCDGIMKMMLPRDVGAWGGYGGKPWDDGVFAAVKRVRVYLMQSANVVCAIQLEYVKRDGKCVSSPKRGGPHCDLIKTIVLDDSNEYLMGISGYQGPVDSCNLEVIKSLTFHTNKAIYGPFGNQMDECYTYFASTPSAGKIVGFHGRNNDFLSAIGVHMEYV